MTPRAIARCLIVLTCTIGSLLVTPGCGRTLMFAERDGVNFAIRADAASKPPVEVNFGLNRVVGTIVPPAGNINGKPAGEAVNMFAGFQVDRPTAIDLTKPLAVDLTIAMQFASGAAALSVAGEPSVVTHIVGVQNTGVAIFPAALTLRGYAHDPTVSADERTRRRREIINAAQDLGFGPIVFASWIENPPENEAQAVVARLKLSPH